MRYKALYHMFNGVSMNLKFRITKRLKTYACHKSKGGRWRSKDYTVPGWCRTKRNSVVKKGQDLFTYHHEEK